MAEALAQLADQIQNGPKHIAAIDSDLRAFYAILCTLQSHLDDEGTASGVLHPAASGDIQILLNNCTCIFQEFHLMIQGYLGAFANRQTRPWQRAKWTWEEKEVLQLRDQLGAHKITLNVAIAAANLINSTRTDATTERIENDVQYLKTTLTTLLTRLDYYEEQRLETNVVRVNYETTLRRVAQDATSILSSINPDMRPSISVGLENVVSTPASRSTYETAALVPMGQSAYEPDAECTPDLEYTGSTFLLSLYFHGTPQHVDGMKKHLRQKAFGLSTTSLRQLCLEILAELTERDSPGAKMDFYFYGQLRSLQSVRESFEDDLDFILPSEYRAGGTCFLPPVWIYHLHSRTAMEWGPSTKFTPPTVDSDRWRLVFMRVSQESRQQLASGLLTLPYPLLSALTLPAAARPASCYYCKDLRAMFERRGRNYGLKAPELLELSESEVELSGSALKARLTTSPVVGVMTVDVEGNLCRCCKQSQQLMMSLCLVRDCRATFNLGGLGSGSE